MVIQWAIVLGRLPQQVLKSVCHLLTVRYSDLLDATAAMYFLKGHPVLTHKKARFFPQKLRKCFFLAGMGCLYIHSSTRMVAILAGQHILAYQYTFLGELTSIFQSVWRKACRRVLSLHGLSTKKVVFLPFQYIYFCPVLHQVSHMGNNNI